MTISDRAAEMAKAILANEGKESWGIRVFIAGQSCCGPSYGMNLQETQMPDDEVVEKNGFKVFMDKETMQSLADRELDYYVGEEGEGFLFTGGISSCAGGSCGTGGGCGTGCES